jgi:succinate dehydrogenase / fumarate reductase flavoprotein subunit
MVTKVCNDAPNTIEWLDSLGVPFDRTNNGSIAQRQLGGASSKRACYAQDYTGLKILHTLYDSCLKEDIEIRDELFLLNLIVEDGITKGCIFLDISTGKVIDILAKSVIIATGGYASIYKNYTTNSDDSTGDGIASVLRAGGRISDMEFVQFHPTALRHSSILISESARGEGGYLVNSKGIIFVDELLPRDVVARAIALQISQGEEVFLDIRHLGKEKLLHLMPQEIDLARLHEGVDPITELIPIKPVAHYTMGGIDVNIHLEVNGLKTVMQ